MIAPEAPATFTGKPIEPAAPINALNLAIAQLELFALRVRAVEMRGANTEEQLQLAFSLLQQARAARRVYTGAADMTNIQPLRKRKP